MAKSVGPPRHAPLAKPHSLRNRYGFASEMAVKLPGAPRLSPAWGRKPARKGAKGKRKGVVRGSGEALRLRGMQLPGAGSASERRGVGNDHDVVTEFREHRRRDVARVTTTHVEPVP